MQALGRQWLRALLLNLGWVMILLLLLLLLLLQLLLEWTLLLLLQLRNYMQHPGPRPTDWP